MLRFLFHFIFKPLKHLYNDSLEFPGMSLWLRCANVQRLSRVVLLSKPGDTAESQGLDLSRANPGLPQHTTSHRCLLPGCLGQELYKAWPKKAQDPMRVQTFVQINGTGEAPSIPSSANISPRQLSQFQFHWSNFTPVNSESKVQPA